MLPFGYRVGKLPPDFMGGVVVHFPRLKCLYHMDSGELEYIQNGNRRLIADVAIWDWYNRAKKAAKSTEQEV